MMKSARDGGEVEVWRLARVGWEGRSEGSRGTRRRWRPWVDWDMFVVWRAAVDVVEAKGEWFEMLFADYTGRNVSQEAGLLVARCLKEKTATWFDRQLLMLGLPHW